MSAHPESLGYSADVRMEMCVNGFVLAIAQLGPDFVILDKPNDHPPTEAQIAVWIDGRERRWNVHLPDGIDAGRPHTKIA